MKKILNALLLAAIAFSPQATLAEGDEVPSVYSANLHFRPILRAQGIEFRWFRHADAKGFLRYEILRTQEKPNGKFIQGGTIAGHTANRYSTNFDEELYTGKYYYQLCIVTKSARTCSGQKEVVIKNGIPRPPAAEEAEIKYSLAPVGELELRVASDEAGNLHLSWTPLTSAAGKFKYYKPLRSTTTDDPFYPRDGYLAHIAEWDKTVAIDDRAPAGTVHYRVCAVDEDDKLFCGNVVKVGGEGLEMAVKR